jgi:spoIIIJ-associated protein
VTGRYSTREIVVMSEPNEDQQIDSGWDVDEGGPDEGGADDAPLEGEAQAAPSGEAGESPAEGTDQGPPRRRRRRRRKPRSPGPNAAPRQGGTSDAPNDERTERALEFVMRLLDDMDMDCEAELLPPRPEEPNEVQIDIQGPDAGRIIGKKGQVLAAIQYLTNRVVNRPGLDKRYVTVDAEGYRSRRDDTLATMARRLGKQAVTEGKIITFEPMNPRDRRVIHLALAKFDGVVTRSEGEGDDRRVQIIPVRR